MTIFNRHGQVLRKNLCKTWPKDSGHQNNTKLQFLNLIYAKIWQLNYTHGNLLWSILLQCKVMASNKESTESSISRCFAWICFRSVYPIEFGANIHLWRIFHGVCNLPVSVLEIPKKYLIQLFLIVVHRSSSIELQLFNSSIETQLLQ